MEHTTFSSISQEKIDWLSQELEYLQEIRQNFPQFMREYSTENEENMDEVRMSCAEGSIEYILREMEMISDAVNDLERNYADILLLKDEMLAKKDVEIECLKKEIRNYCREGQ